MLIHENGIYRNCIYTREIHVLIYICTVCMVFINTGHLFVYWESIRIWLAWNTQCLITTPIPDWPLGSYFIITIFCLKWCLAYCTSESPTILWACSKNLPSSRYCFHTTRYGLPSTSASTRPGLPSTSASTRPAALLWSSSTGCDCTTNTGRGVCMCVYVFIYWLSFWFHHTSLLFADYWYRVWKFWLLYLIKLSHVQPPTFAVEAWYFPVCMVVLSNTSACFG